jgi:hypothetical protein
MERRGSPPYATQDPATQGGAKQAASRAADESKQVAQTAGEQTREVVGAVKEQAGDVVATAKQQGRNVAHETREQLRHQADSQTQRLAEALRSVGGQVQALADGRTQEAGGTRDYAGQAATTLQEWAGRVESRGFQGLTRDLEQVALRRPGAFLAGAAAAGFVLGRLVRSQSGSEPAATKTSSEGPGLKAGTPPPAPAPLVLPDVTPASLARGFSAQNAQSPGSAQIR